MEIKLIELSGLKSTLIALRKPFKGQIKTDIDNLDIEHPTLNKDDYKLLKKLVKAGDEHAKCIRGFRVTLDVTAPRFFWSEHDTYKVGVDPLSSESTMHTLLKETPQLSDFDEINRVDYDNFMDRLFEVVLYLDADSISKAEAIVRIKRSLPESFLQTRTIQYNYQALRRIYNQRKNHLLPHWKEFCKFLEKLPMSNLITRKE